MTVDEAIRELESRKSFLMQSCAECWPAEMEMALQALKTQQWHTGEPSKSGDYLCYVKFDMTDGGSHEWIEHGYEVCAYYDTDGSFEGDYAGWQSYGIVLAWMPLPDPPEVDYD